MVEPSSSASDASASGEVNPQIRYALERTFLAWIRTALALITAGLVITQLLPAFNVAGGRRVVGLPLIALGTFLAIAAFFRWDRDERALQEGRPLGASRLPLIVAVSVALVAVIALVLASIEGVGT